MYMYQSASLDFLQYITSLPDGTIVLAAAYDSATNGCNSECTQGLQMIGESGQGVGFRGN